MQRDGRLVEVELVEDVADEEDTTPRDPWWRPLLARVVARTPRWVWSVVAATVVVAVAAWLVTHALAAAARDARLARTDGLSVSLAQPLTEGWRTRGFFVVAVSDDAALVSVPPEGSLTAVELDTGAERYALTGACTIATERDGMLLGFGVPEAMTVQDGDLVMCVAGASMFEPLPSDEPSDPARVTVHDPATGDVLRRFALTGAGHPWAIGRTAFGLGIDPEGHVSAERWSLLTGQRMWSYRSAEPVPNPLTQPWLTGHDSEVVHLTSDGWAATLDLATGEELATDERPDHQASTYERADGTKVSIRMDRADGTQRSTVSGPDGQERFTVSGAVTEPSVDDGTAAGTLFVVDPDAGVVELVAVDPVSGEERWSAEAGGFEIAVLSGVVIAASDTGITALDASTGEVRWATSVPRYNGATWGMVTDGRRVMTVEREGSTSSLVAREVGTGDPLWDAPLPVPPDSGFVALTQLPDGTVVVMGADELVTMRP